MKQIQKLMMAAGCAIASLPLPCAAPRYEFANIGEGTYPTGQTTRLTDAGLTTRHLTVKIGSDVNHVAVAGTADIALGVVDDAAEAAEDPVNVQVLGQKPGTILVTASAAITLGDMVVTAASGKVRTLPVASGTYYIIGRALEAAVADGDLINIAHCFPVQRVV